MSFLAPGRLWLLLAVAALLAGYVAVSLRRRRYAVRFTNLALLASVAPRRPQWWRRHVPALLLLLSLASLVVSLARPTGVTKVPRERATVMLAIDVSNSMAATDVAPNRLAAAKAGAKEFVARIPARIQLGLASFSGTASVLVAPTTDRDAVNTGIDGLQLGPATAIGEGIYACLQAVKDSAALDKGPAGPPPARIVLLSDGETTRGRPNDDAAAAAKTAGVPVSTIAYGTQDGTLDVAGQQIPVPVNEAALKDIASRTGGTFHRATSGDEIKQVYRDLGSQIGYRDLRRETGRWFTGLALVLGLLAGAMSVLFTSRLP